jgi:opacity protein-like surface antigen
MVAAALVAVAGEVQAQGLRVSPWIGMYAPTAKLGSVQAIEFGEKESTLAYGATLDFGGSNSLLGFRIDGAYATNSDVPIDGVGCTSCELRSTVLTAAGALVLRPFPMPMLRPYAVAGLGGKWYDFDIDANLENTLKDQTKFTALAGLGVAFFPNSPINLVVELTDYISGFDFEDGNVSTTSNTQHDLFFKAGLSIGLGSRR